MCIFYNFSSFRYFLNAFPSLTFDILSIEPSLDGVYNFFDKKRSKFPGFVFTDGRRVASSATFALVRVSMSHKGNALRHRVTRHGELQRRNVPVCYRNKYKDNTKYNIKNSTKSRR